MNNLILSFLAGVFLNFMPCVLPILSLKIYDIIKYSQTNKNKKNLRLISLASTCGIVFIFSIFAIITIIFRKTGENFHLGFHFQNSYFLIIIIILLFLFFLNSLNFFHLNYHPRIVNFIQKKYNDAKLLKAGIFSENFITAICMVLFSLPCCMPIFGSLATLALLNDNYIAIFLNFIFTAIGMSLPFILIQIKPTIFDFLKNKKNLLKYTSNFISFAICTTIIWFIYVLSKEIGIKATTIFLLFLFIIPIQFKLIKNHLHNLIFIVFITIFATILPVSYFKEEQATKISNSLWQNKIDIKNINQYINNDKTLFINISASWCMICNLNEITTLSKYEVVNFLKNNKIIAIKLDITKNNKEADYFFKNQKNIGVPTYIIYNKKCYDGNLFTGQISSKKLFEEFKKCNIK